MLSFNRFFAFSWMVALAVSILFAACADTESAGECESSSSVELVSSSSRSKSSSSLKKESYKGFIKISTAEKKTFLGVNLDGAKADERPQMGVKFSYDFFMQRSEVTCGDFNSLMGKKIKLKCKSDSLPATDVTFFDAVLYANAKSKKEKLDSAYKYVSREYDSEGHCVGLEGFSFLPESKGYRLPTEAEWILAASLFKNDSKSWTAENSDYKLHSVCSKTKDTLEVCDLIGNAMEWVNDWRGYFRDTTVTNFVGAPDGGALGERVVKGGSYKSPLSSIKMYSRGDVYSVVSSSHADYIGFRLAVGAIPSAVWMSSSGKMKTSKMTVLSNSASVEAVTGTYQTKLAFRNDVSGNLAFIDYSNGVLSVTEIEDTLDVYHPEISPDGKRVAFCTGLEGVGGKSTLYVRNLDAKGSNLIKLKGVNAAIPRWRIMENGDTAIVYVSDAGSNADEGTWQRKSTWVVRLVDGTFGVPNRMFDGAFHGGVSDDNRFAVTGAKLLRTRIADSGATLMTDVHDFVWNGGEQACNVSLSKDDSKRTLFLDFGGKTGKKYVGENYGVHERILVLDSSGNFVQSVAAPEGFSFDHSEWAWSVSDTANKAGVAVATLTNADGAHTKIVMVNFANDKIVGLVEGDELWHPSLWIKPLPPPNHINLNVDSAGVYYLPSGNEASIMLRYKMELLWKYHDSSEVVIVGSSRSLNGVDPVYLDSAYHAVNLSNVPNSIYESAFLLEHYILPHFKKLKYVIVSLDLDMWWKSNSDASDNFFYSEYLNYPGYIYDMEHSYWIEGYPEGLAERTHEALGNEYFANKLLSTRGFNNEDCTEWTKDVKPDYDSTWLDFMEPHYKENLIFLDFLIQMATVYNVKLVGVIFPQNPNYKETGAFGRYGLRRSEAPALIEELRKKSDENASFILMDENKMGDHDYGDYDNQNDDHLCRLGAMKFTKRLDSLLKTLE